MNLTNILYYLFFFITAYSPPEVVVFDVIRQDNVIGELKAARVVANELTLFRSQTKISTHFVIKVNVEYEFFVTMKKGQLLSSEATIIVNGKVKEHTRTKWMGDEYRIEDRKGRISWISDPITYSSVHLLFREPMGVSRLYSEEEGEYLSVETHDKHSYKKMSAKGKEHLYHYRDGKLKHAEMKTGMLNFQIVLQEEL